MRRPRWPRCRSRNRWRRWLAAKKELQQAARQVREAKAVARTEPESPEGVIARLKQTITELSIENAALKTQLAELTR